MEQRLEEFHRVSFPAGAGQAQRIWELAASGARAKRISLLIKITIYSTGNP